MKSRIAMWAGAGILTVCLWQAYVFAIAPTPILAHPIAWSLARLSCPVLFLSFQFHFALPIAFVLVANSVTYALIGLTLHSLNRLRHLYSRAI